MFISFVYLVLLSRVILRINATGVRNRLSHFSCGMLIWTLSWTGCIGINAKASESPIVEANIYYQHQPSKLYHGHTLDIYYAQSRDLICPIVIFIHAGAWQYMDKSHRHARDTGRFLARHGVHAIVVNHRSKSVQHPTHIQDVASAFSWVVEHAEEIGGDRRAIFVAGLSSGAHLATLLAVDPQYLAVHQLVPHRDIAGVIAISGIYDVDLRFRSGRVFRTHLVERPFGKDRTRYSEASPLHQLHQTAVAPIMLFSARGDPRVLVRQANAFYQKLRQTQSVVWWRPKVWGTHLTVMFGLTHKNSPDSQALIDFVYLRTRHRLRDLD